MVPPIPTIRPPERSSHGTSPSSRATCLRSAFRSAREGRWRGRKRSVIRTAPSGRESVRPSLRPITWEIWTLPPPRSSTWPSPRVLLLTAPRYPYQASSSADRVRTCSAPPADRASSASAALAASRTALVATAATSSTPAAWQKAA